MATTTRPARQDRITSAIDSGRGRALIAPRIVAMLLIVAAATVVGLTGSSSLRYALAIGGVYAMSIMANSFVLGTLDEIDLGSSAWIALGAYVCCICLNHDVRLSLSIAAAVATTALVGFIVAIPTVRLKGIFTALATFALAFATPQLVVYFEKHTGGAAGQSLPFGMEIFGMQIGGSEPGTLIAVNVVFAIVALLTLVLLESGLGRRAILIGEAEPAAAVLGVNITVVKVLVWTWSAAIGGLAGAFFALTVGFLAPDQFHFFLGITLFVGAVVAGSRSIWAAWIGGAIVGVVPGQLQSIIPSSATGILFGLILLAAILAGSGGLARFIERGIVRITGRLARKEVA